MILYFAESMKMVKIKDKGRTKREKMRAMHKANSTMIQHWSPRILATRRHNFPTSS